MELPGAWSCDHEQSIAGVSLCAFDSPAVARITSAANRQMEALRGTRMRIRAPREINGVATVGFSRSYCDHTAIATTAREQLAYHGIRWESLANWKRVAEHLRISASFRHKTLPTSEEYTQARSGRPAWLPHLKPTRSDISTASTA